MGWAGDRGTGGTWDGRAGEQLPCPQVESPFLLWSHSPSTPSRAETLCCLPCPLLCHVSHLPAALLTHQAPSAHSSCWVTGGLLTPEAPVAQ